MKNHSLNEIKKELQFLDAPKLIDLLLVISKYKKDNKELLAYLLFEAENEDIFLNTIKREMDQLFDEINPTNSYLAKKSLRKILKFTNKFIKFSGKKTAEIELLLHFYKNLNTGTLDFKNSVTLQNLQMRLSHKITKSISQLHEDLQYDYRKLFEQIH